MKPMKSYAYYRTKVFPKPQHNLFKTKSTHTNVDNIPEFLFSAKREIGIRDSKHVLNHFIYTVNINSWEDRIAFTKYWETALIFIVLTIVWRSIDKKLALLELILFVSLVILT